MKFNPDLARTILLALEENPSPHAPKRIEVGDASQEEFSYHVMLLAQDNLIEARDSSHGGRTFSWYPIRLTMAGHRFLDASREPSRWEKAKTVVMEKTGGLGWEAI